jgi:mono/diheme cytochrome c family protein
MFERFVNGFQIVVAMATVITIVLLFTVTPSAADPARVVEVSGADLFSANCAGCHGASGEGGVGPVLAGGLSRFGSIEEVATFVSTGVPGRMPGFETRLTPEEIEAVVDHVWSDVAARSAG